MTYVNDNTLDEPNIIKYDSSKEDSMTCVSELETTSWSQSKAL